MIERDELNRGDPSTEQFRPGTTPIEVVNLLSAGRNDNQRV
jgi:hypothetical protein